MSDYFACLDLISFKMSSALLALSPVGCATGCAAGADSATFTIAEKQKLMKTLEATDWKLWELYQIAEGFRQHFDITKPEIKG